LDRFSTHCHNEGRFSYSMPRKYCVATGFRDVRNPYDLDTCSGLTDRNAIPRLWPVQPVSMVGDAGQNSGRRVGPPQIVLIWRLKANVTVQWFGPTFSVQACDDFVTFPSTLSCFWSARSTIVKWGWPWNVLSLVNG